MSEIVHGLLDSFDYGRGFVEPIYPDDPPAGQSFGYQFPGQYDSRLQFVTVQLKTDGTAGNRLLTIDYLDGNGVALTRDGIAVLIPSGSTQLYLGQSGRGESSAVAGAPIWFPLCGRFGKPGQSISITVTGIQAGDQLSGIVLVFERFPNDPAGYPEGEGRRGVPRRPTRRRLHA